MPTPLRRIVLSGALVAIAAVWLLPATSAQRESRSQDAFATVVDRDGAPVTNLGVDDFVVREDGLVREILRVEPAPPPSPIALLVDTSQAAEPVINDLRKATAAFIEAISRSDQPPLIGLTTFGERPTKLADFTQGPVLDLAIDRIFSRAGTGAYLLEAIMETTAEFGQGAGTRPAIVAFVAEAGPEFSTTQAEQVAEALQRSHATLWTIVLQSRFASGTSPEIRERARVVTDVATDSGGLNRTVLSRQGIPDAFARIASLLASTYRITYGRPDTLIPPETLEITARREGLRLLAPRWATQ
jgi:hypothetical protein